jgi:hypothetical protein
MDGKQVQMVVSYLVQLSSCVICCQLIIVRHSNGMYTFDCRDMDCQVQCNGGNEALRCLFLSLLSPALPPRQN